MKSRLWVVLLLLLPGFLAKFPIAADSLKSLNWRLTLERTACYGPCPVYTVEVQENGQVVFEGRKYVSKIGTQKAEVPLAVTKKLKQRLDDLNFLDLPANFEKTCSFYITDLPGMTITLSEGSRSRTVRDDQGCRGNELLKKIQLLGDEIDAALETKRWKS